MVTPVDSARLGECLRAIGYDKDKTVYLEEGFKNGFKICHPGPYPKGYDAQL